MRFDEYNHEESVIESSAVEKNSRADVLLE